MVFDRSNELLRLSELRHRIGRFELNKSSERDFCFMCFRQGCVLSVVISLKIQRTRPLSITEQQIRVKGAWE